MANRAPTKRPKKKRSVVEMVGGVRYEYVPLGQYVVSAPGVCRGRPTFKYTRVEVAGVLEWLGAGNSLREFLTNAEGRITPDAVLEAAALAGNALARQVRPKVRVS